MDGRMTRTLGLLAPLALLGLVACGGGDGGEADVDEWCELNEELWSNAEALTDGGSGVDVEALVDDQTELLDDAADVAPDEVRDDAGDLANGWTDFADLLADADFDATEIDTDDLLEVTDDLGAEVQSIREFNAEECDLDIGDVGLFPTPDAPIVTGEPSDDTGPTDGTEPTDDTGDGEPVFTLPDITVDGSIPTGTGETSDSAVVDMLADQFEQMGLPADKAQCLAEQMDVDDLMEGDQPDTSEMFEWIETCEISFEELGDLGDNATDTTVDTPDVGDVTIPDDGGDVGDVDQMVTDMVVDSLGLTEEQANCLVDKMDVSSGSTPDMSEMMDLFEECDINPLDLDTGG